MATKLHNFVVPGLHNQFFGLFCSLCVASDRSELQNHQLGRRSGYVILVHPPTTAPRKFNFFPFNWPPPSERDTHLIKRQIIKYQPSWPPKPTSTRSTSGSRHCTNRSQYITVVALPLSRWQRPFKVITSWRVSTLFLRLGAFSAFSVSTLAPSGRE